MFERLVMAEKTRQCLCLCFSMASGQFGAKINSSSGPRLLGKDNERDYSGKQLTLTPFSSFFTLMIKLLFWERSPYRKG